MLEADKWISGDASALVLREYLVPVEGRDAPFFPPTFAGSKDSNSPYCIDTVKDGTQTCLVDSVGSQANRMEPIFTKEPYSKLVPQVRISAPSHLVNLCEVGHRAADALIRHSTINGEITEALDELKSGDASSVGKIAPTSLVFGLWDSRNTQVKVPRIVSSVIRAYDVDELSRSAQYFPPIKYTDEDILSDSKDRKEKDARSEIGFNEAPAVNTHGGVIAHGPIQRDVVVNLAALRKIRADSSQEVLQKYVLGLALVAASSIREWDLRQGCLLVRDPDKGSPEWEIVYPDGKREKVGIEHGEVLKWAQKAADDFGVGKDINAEFQKNVAKSAIKEKMSKKGGKKTDGDE